MAVIGHAEIVVRAITNNFEKELKDTLKNVSKSISVGAGRQIGDGFADGFNRSRATSIFGKLSDGLRSMVPEAEAARERFQSLVRVGYVLNGVLGLVAGAISSVVVSIGPLIGSLLRAVSAAGILVNAFVALRVAIAVGRTAFGNIFQAVQQATQVNGGYAKSLKDIREEWQQLLFDAEAASYSEEEAALNLEKAFNNLRRMADLPPNSMARREAELEYRQADLAYRRAKDRTKDLNETVQEGFDAFKDAQRTAGGAGADPLSQLNAAQKKFAERLIQLNPKLDRLKLKMSDAFLTPLYETVDVFEQRLLPILDKRLPEIAGQAGEAINQVFTGLNFDRIDAILSEMTTPFEEGGRSNLQLFGDILGQILDLFLKILDATGKPLNDLLTSIKDSFGEFVANADTKKMEEFFTGALEEAKKWVPIISNIFGGLKNLMDLTTGPGSAGEYMLEWFTEATSAFRNMFAEDPDAGKQFFKDAMVNARSVLSSIGALVKAILGVADNPNIAIAFDKLKEGAPSIGEMLDKMIDAAPSFATFIVEVVDLINTLVDADQIEAFFDTLTIAVRELTDFLKSPLGKAFLENLGPIFATFSAIGLIFDGIKFAFQVLIGYLALMFLGAEKFLSPITKAKDALKTMGGKDMRPPGMQGPVMQGGAFTTDQAKKQADMFKKLGNVLKGAGVLGAILLVVTKIQEFYDESLEFRNMIDNVFGGVGDSFGRLGESIGKLFDTFFGEKGFGGVLDALDPILQFILMQIIPAIGGAISWLVDSLAHVIDFISSTLGALFTGVTSIVSGIMDLFGGNFKVGLAKILGGIGILALGIVEFIVNGVITLINVFLIDSINNFIRDIANGPIGKFLKDTFGLDVGRVKVGKIGLVNWTEGAKNNLDRYVGAANASRNQRIKADGMPKLAMGGIVYPSSGGTVVNVAEAGRPERIEPLNPNGLSERDIALINQMGGGPKVSITVNPAPGMDEKELAAAVSRRLAFEIRKGTI